jgi:ABC-type uncharacterized transport system ATPase subunit
VRFGQPISDTFELENTTILKRGTWGVKIELDTHIRPVENLIAALMAYAPIVDLTVEDPPMEEIIAEIYQAEDTITVEQPTQITEAEA